ncbi:hypothetical protein A1O1_08149 [Capronia coronata CBS 617.96]|uniref:Uncharacterized protein n=1 Tax=Capronia coronata CBS 617.96 TaxID=1182541 RepID=W9XXI9_9EURO|nr:uncharacterized protein A1O1_08149 [Capronia coronata CBS 617.96]EXJ82080.1 hypothetical protein A1O1_08149 [Capronia coronata CBS 617.96]
MVRLSNIKEYSPSSTSKQAVPTTEVMRPSSLPTRAGMPRTKSNKLFESQLQHALAQQGLASETALDPNWILDFHVLGIPGPSPSSQV